MVEGRDTNNIELERSVVEIVRSGQASGDTIFFSVTSGVRLGLTSFPTSFTDLTPGLGYIVRRSGGKDSVYFNTGRVTFRGTSWGIYMDGTCEISLPDTTTTLIAPDELGWRMAR